MNKKIVIGIIIVLLIIVVGILIYKSSNSQEEENTLKTITQEEANNKVIDKVKEKLEQAGLELRNEKEVKVFLDSENNGYSYNVAMENSLLDEEEIEIHIINPREKKQLVGDTQINGEVTIEYGNKQQRALVYGTVLILNCENTQIKNAIKTALE